MLTMMTGTSASSSSSRNAARTDHPSRSGIVTSSVMTRAIKIDGGHCVTRRQRDKLRMTADEQRVGTDQEGASTFLEKGGEGGRDVTISARAEDVDLQPKSGSPRLHVPGHQLITQIGRIDEHREARRRRQKFVQ